MTTGCHEPNAKSPLAPARSRRWGTLATMSALYPEARLGPYRLTRRLGKGAFAEVWLAVEEGQWGSRRKVALKIFLGLDEEDDRTASLINEVRIGGHLHHPHVVQFLNAGQIDDRWFMAMEFVDGPTLKQVVRALPKLGLRFPRAVVVDLGIQMAEALAHAHKLVDHEGKPMGLVHRDLKPANVLLSRKLGVKIADFGVAKSTTNVEATTAGTFKGTPAYTAPEAWSVSARLDAKADLFSLGAVLWEMVTLKRLLRGPEIPAIAAQAMNGSAREEAEELRDYMPDLIPLVEGLLQRDPARRIPTAQDALNLLHRVREAYPNEGNLSLFLDLLHLTPQERQEGLTPEESWRRARRAADRDTSWARLIDPDMATSSADAEVADSLADALTSTSSIIAPAEDLNTPPYGTTGVTQVRAPEAAAPEAAAPPPGLPLTPTTSTSTADAGVQTLMGQAAEPAPPPRTALPMLAAGVATLTLLVLVGLLFRPQERVIEPGLVPHREPADGTALGIVFEDEPQAEAEPAPTPTPRRRPTTPPSQRPAARPAATPPPTPTPSSDAAPNALTGGGIAPRPTRELDLAPPPLPRATPQPTPASTPTPAPREARPTHQQSTLPPEPTPRPLPPQGGCLAFQSSPPGAAVWIDGTKTSHLALSRPRSPAAQEAGRVLVGMGGRGTVAADVLVTVRAGEATLVICELTGTPSCRAQPMAGGCP